MKKTGPHDAQVANLDSLNKFSGSSLVLVCPQGHDVSFTSKQLRATSPKGVRASLGPCVRLKEERIQGQNDFSRPGSAHHHCIASQRSDH